MTGTPGFVNDRYNGTDNDDGHIPFPEVLTEIHEKYEGAE